MNKHIKLLFSALIIIVIVLAAAITRFFSDTGKDTYEGGAQSAIAKKLETDQYGNMLFRDASGNYGIADSSERVIVQPEWEKLTFTDSGLCIAEKTVRGSKLLGCIDYEGNAVVPFIYDSIERRSINGASFYTAKAHSDGSLVLYNESLTPVFSRSWKNISIGDKDMTLSTDKGSYVYSVNSNGSIMKNAVLSGKTLSSDYRIDITSKLLLSKLSVPMLEEMAESAGKYIEYAFTEDESVLDDIIRSDNAVFNPLFPDEKRIDSKRLLSIPDIFLYSTRSDDDTPHFAVAVTADTEISYHDDNDKLCRMNDRYKAVIEFKGSSAGELKAVSGAFTVNAPDYPAPEPEHPAINEHPENIVGYSTENNSIQQNNTVTASDNKSQN